MIRNVATGALCEMRNLREELGTRARRCTSSVGRSQWIKASPGVFVSRSAGGLWPLTGRRCPGEWSGTTIDEDPLAGQKRHHNPWGHVEPI